MFVKNNKNILIIFIFFLIVTTSYFIDFYWTKSVILVPAWDQGFHLSNLYQFSNLINNLKLFDNNWWVSFWSITDNYRGPLTYTISSFFINLFGINFQNAILSNFIYSIILSISVLIFCIKFLNYEVGIWSVFFYYFNPFIFNLRNDFLIDLPQSSFISLTSLLFILWFTDNKNNNFFPIASGFSLGLLFLTKPSGLIYFIFPLILLIKKTLDKKNIFNLKIYFKLIISLLVFFIVIKPWLSINWVTIFTSTINAWQWGIKYQDGLEINTIEGWVYYPNQIIKAINPIILLIIISNFIIYRFKFFRYKIFHFLNLKKSLNLNSKNIFILSIPLNILLVNLIMTTKDPRFVLPLMPFIFIFLGKLIYELNNKYLISRIMKLLIIISVIFIFSFNQIKIYNNSINIFKHQDNPNKIHSEIINAIKINSPNVDSTVGFLPDTEFYNAFNLDAAALKINKGIRVRQITSNKDSYKRDLKLFDWFVIKTGNQGEMRSFSKDKLNNILSNTDSFEVFKEWKLHDQSVLKLIKRKEISNNLKTTECSDNKVSLNLGLAKNKLKINLKGELSEIGDSYLILKSRDGINENKIYLSLPKIKEYNSKQKCINYTAIFEKNKNLIKSYQISDFDVFLLNPKNGKEFELTDKQTYILNEDYYLLASNKLEYVQEMGNLLREGEFDELFNLAGQINQSDPNQYYLKDAEIIFEREIKQEPNNLDYLYSLLISQILQKKAIKATDTLNKIILIDPYNSNVHIANVILKIYLFDIKSINKSLEKAIKYNEDPEIGNWLDNIYSLTKILSFNLINKIKS